MIATVIVIHCGVVWGTTSPSTPLVADAPAATPTWWSRVQQTIAQLEYGASFTPDGLQAPNRAQDFRTYFRTAGVDIVDRRSTRGEPAWRFRWRTVAWGRPAALRPVVVSLQHHVENYVEYAHAGGFAEWYRNRPEGLEQGFTISERPAGEGRLVIEGRTGEDLQLRQNPSGDAIDIVTPAGSRVLRYGELHVFDAAGGELPSRLEVGPASIRISIDDGGARYPLLVDPVLTSPLLDERERPVARPLGAGRLSRG